MPTSESTKHRCSSPTPSSDRPLSPTMPSASTNNLHDQDPEKLSHEAWLGGHEVHAKGTDVDTEHMTDELRQADISESHTTSDRRPGISRHDTDTYEDYPSTEPNLSSERVTGSEDLASPLQTTDDDELSTSPYATEHSIGDKRTVVDGSRPTPVADDAAARSATDPGTVSPGWPGSTHNEDPAFDVIGSADHKDLGDAPVHVSATAASHEHVRGEDDNGKTDGKDEHEHQKEGIIGKVASFLTSKKVEDHGESK